MRPHYAVTCSVFILLQMAGRAGSLSIVEYFAEHEGYKCGYCGQEDTNFSHGMWAHTLTCQVLTWDTVRHCGNSIVHSHCRTTKT